jgi:hypothetical protein
MTRFLLILILFSTFLSPKPVQGEGSLRNTATAEFMDDLDYTFEKIYTAVSPSPRLDHALQTDFSGHRIFLFGGRNEKEFLGDLWAFDTGNMKWARIETAPSPSPRSGHCLEYDWKTGTLLLLGGYHADAHGKIHFSRELWTFRPNQGWSQVFFEVGPTARAWQACIIADREMIVFGGSSDALPTKRLDLWSLNLDNLTWRRMASDGGPMMNGRPGLITLDTPKRVVVFGRDLSVKPHRTGLWSLDVEQDRWSYLPPDDKIPATFTLVIGNNVSKSFSILKKPDDSHLEWNLWSVLPTGETEESTLPENSSLPDLQGLACAPWHPGGQGWLCFGGAKQGCVMNDTWLLHVPEDEE